TPIVIGKENSSASSSAGCRRRCGSGALLSSMSVTASSLDPADGVAEGFVLEEQGGVVGAEMAPLEVEPAVNQQRLTGDVARQVGQHKQAAAGLFLGRAAAAHRHRLPV